jgi:CubicO group peptidase (beta-lactamase class C family)
MRFSRHVLFRLAAILVAALILGAANAAHVQTKVAVSSYNFDSIRSFIQQTVERGTVASVAIAVAKDKKIVWEEAFGWANREKMIRATTDTMYSLASVSKPLTATGVMTLLEAGKISLDAPINDYLGDVKLRGLAGDAAGATVRRVLSHTAGLPVHANFFYVNSDERVPSTDQSIFRYGILVNPPGEVYQYSNLGYGILDYVISRVSGISYVDFMRTRVFLPLGMTHTSVGIGSDLDMYAAERYDTHQEPLPFYDFDHRGASAVYSSIHDMVRFGMFHLKDHLPNQEPILNDATLDLTKQIETADALSSTPYGFGWRVITDHGYLRYSHSGGMPGVSANIVLYPAEDTVIVVLTNSHNAEIAEKVTQQIASAVLPQYATSLKAESKTPKPSAARFQPPSELVGEWSGIVRTWQGTVPLYLTIRPDGDVHVKLGDQLETILNEAKFDKSRFTGRFTGDIPTPDAERYAPHFVRLDMYLRARKLSGEITTEATEEPAHFALSSYVDLSLHAAR